MIVSTENVVRPNGVCRGGAYCRWGKRLLDVFVASVGLFLTAPILLAVAMAVRLSSQGPILFRQARIGRGGIGFEVLKFRTMTEVSVPRTPQMEVERTDPEVTRIGALLRRLKLDELPQMFNVLVGDMSLVGPRPALPAQLGDYDDYSRKRLLVRPGMTGLAQVNGNNHLPWPERWKWDVEYVETYSLKVDLQILAETIRVVLAGDDHRVRGFDSP